MLSTFNQSIRLIIGRRFYRINSEDCTSNGYQDIATLNDCELAAKALGLTDYSVYGHGPLQVEGKPYGCIYASSDWLSWAPEDGHPYGNVPCGTYFAGVPYDCICLTGNI